MKYIAYYRVSTPKQGVSGLGLEAQRASVLAYLRGMEQPWNTKSKTGEADQDATGPYSHSSTHGNTHHPNGNNGSNGNGNCPFLEFTEVESGKRSDNRPRLAEAIQACRVYKATLVIARIDRLARNAHFVLGLKESGIEFVAVDLPTANHLTVALLAVLAEEYSRSVSVNTKAALKAAKARGVVLGGQRRYLLGLDAEGHKVYGDLVSISKDDAALGPASRKAKANARARDLTPIIHEIWAEGAVSLREVAKRLNDRGVPTARGNGEWSASQVSRVLDRI